MPRFKKASAASIVFVMIDAADTTLVKTGLSVAAEVSKDGGAFAAAANSVSEIGGGFYALDLAASEMDADAVALKLAASGAVQQNLVLYTDARLVGELHDFDPAAEDVYLSDTDLADLKDSIKGSPEGRTVREAYDQAAAARTTTDKLETALEPDGEVHRFTQNALEQAPSGSGWTAEERSQIRQALGVAGEAGETTGTGHLDLVLARLAALLGHPVVVASAVTAAGQDVVRFRGDTVPLAFDLGRDITGASLRFTLKRRASDSQADALVSKSSANPDEIAITDAAAGRFEVRFAAADTEGLLPTGRRATFLYDAEMTLDGAVETVAAGDLVLLADVTTPD
ncbi:MAG: hypothetical protein ACLF0G_17750 [Candidatus Brocadiia bacterium]